MDDGPPWLLIMVFISITLLTVLIIAVVFTLGNTGSKETTTEPQKPPEDPVD